MGDKVPSGRDRAWLLQLVLAGLGILVIAGILERFGIDALLHAFTDVQPSLLILYGATLVAIYFAYTLRWRALLRALGADCPLGRLLGIRLGGLAVGSLTPGAKLGGEPLRAYLLSRDRVPSGVAIASVIVDRGLELWANVVFGLSYSGLFALRDFNMARRVFVVILASGVALAVWVVRRLGQLRRGRSLVPKQFIPVMARLGASEAMIRDTDQAVDRLIFGHRGLIATTFLWSLLINALIFAEYAVLFAAFSVVPPIPDLAGVLLGVGLAHALPVPASLGALEGAQVALFHLSNGPQSFGLVAAAMSRIRDTVWTVPGAIYLFVASMRGRREIGRAS